LAVPDIFSLLEEAQELFEVEFDAPPPLLSVEDPGGLTRTWYVDLDGSAEATPPNSHSQAFTLWLRSSNFAAQRIAIASLLRRLLRNNPFTTLQVVLDPKHSDAPLVRSSLDPEAAAALLAACQEQPTIWTSISPCIRDRRAVPSGWFCSCRSPCVRSCRRLRWHPGAKPPPWSGATVNLPSSRCTSLRGKSALHPLADRLSGC